MTGISGHGPGSGGSFRLLLNELHSDGRRQVRARARASLVKTSSKVHC